jgi:hypothetical protein
LSEGLGRGRRGLLIFLAFLSGTTGYFWGGRAGERLAQGEQWRCDCHTVLNVPLGILATVKRLWLGLLLETRPCVVPCLHILILVWKDTAVIGKLQGSRWYRKIVCVSVFLNIIVGTRSPHKNSKQTKIWSTGDVLLVKCYF